jgi:phosphate-selective porin
MRTATRIAVMGLLLAATAALVGAAGLAAPVQAQEETGREWGYDKGFWFRQGNFELKISTRTQFRFTRTWFEEASGDEDRGEFTLPRTRLSLDGHAYYPWLKYKIQYDFTGDDDSNGPDPETEKRPDLRDLYLDFAKNGVASVRLGQFKAPFGLQELTSSGNQEFVDRSIASVEFAPSRQQGAMLYGATEEKKFGYEVGVFNGNGRNKPENDNDKYLVAARIHFDPNGEYKLSETAVDHPDTANWTIGAAWQTNTEDAAGDFDETSVEGFFALKYKRLFVLADYYQRTLETAMGDVDSDGAIAQVGYFFVPRKFEVALRFSQVDPDTDADDDTLTESRISVGWYFSKHDLKFQADYGRLEDDADPAAETDVFRGQLQIVF